MKPTHRKRLEPWPIAIIAFYTLFASAFVTFAVVISAHQWDLVTDDYYEQTLTYEDHLQAVRRAQALSEPPSIVARNGQYTVSFPASLAADVESITLSWYRPDDADLDRTDVILLDAEGRFSAAVPPSGRYRLTLRWTSAGALYAQPSQQFVTALGGR